jgi:ATP synthase F1 epsilon subunit
MENKELFVSVVSPYKPLYQGKANSVILPLYDGVAGILKNHAEMIAELGSGKLTIKNEEEVLHFFINGGFVEVSKNKITVLASEAFKKEDLKKEIIEKEYQDVRKIPVKGDEEINQKLQKLDAIRKKLSFIKEV